MVKQALTFGCAGVWLLCGLIIVSGQEGQSCIIMPAMPVFGRNASAKRLIKARMAIRRITTFLAFIFRMLCCKRSRQHCFCVEAFKVPIAKYGKPEIMNADQGSQFTGSAWITTLTDAKPKSMVVGAISTTSSSNDFGGHSNRGAFTCTNCRMASKSNASSRVG